MNIHVFQVAAVAAAVSFSAPALAQEMDVGEKNFQQYCGTCHGAGAKGDGDLANMMTVPVPDLTKLSAGNHGVFPMLEVIHIIDGRTGMRGHGGPMPVYGALFDDEISAGPYGGPIYTRGKILSIAYFLEQLQE